ncbi:MAG: transporter permease [Actinomycetia bacterium]|nr:transporter permease [Actinomycetes bacterium]
MTAVIERPAAPPVRAPWRDRVRRAAIWAALVFVTLAVVRQVTGANALTSAGTVNDAIGLAVPIGLAALGGLFSERAGVVNIGLEGMMIFGTWFAGWAGYQWGPWAAVLGGIAGGALFGLVHALATVTFGVDHIISGVAINIIAVGATRYLSSRFFLGREDGGVNQSPSVPLIGRVGVPGAGGPLGTLEGKHWFLVSDLAGLLRGLFTDVSLLTILAVLLVPAAFWLLWRTGFGLRLRSVGESPVAAESLGVPVYTMKYAGVVISGALAGLGGAFLVTVYDGKFLENQTGGRGFIGLAAMIFGNWRPGGLAAGSALFGYTDSLRLREGSAAVHALLLFAAILLAILAIRAGVTRRWIPAGALAVAAVGFGVVFAVTDQVPAVLTPLVPYAVTLVVLALAAKRLRMPAADGLRYRKGETG